MEQGKRQLQKEATRQTILNTAIRIYSVTGFSTPTNIIAQEAGISHGSIFAHFPTRGDLQRSVLEQFTKNVGTKLHHISVSGSSLSELLYAHIEILEGCEAFYKELISEIPGLSEDTRNTVIALQSIMSRHFDTVITTEKKKGAIKEIPLHMMFNTWIALLHYYLQNSEWFAPGESVLRRYKDELVNSYMALVTK